MFYFSIYWVFFRGVGIQPPTRKYSYLRTSRVAPGEASSVHAQLLRCVKALGAFDLQLLQLCPEITVDGLAAMQVTPGGVTNSVLYMLL